MKIHYSLDDSAARLPLTIRSADGVWDRAAELRHAPGIHLVELITQHMLNTGAKLSDELAHYFDHGSPGESDPYALAECYANRDLLADLLRDLRDAQPDLVAFHEVEALFPSTFLREPNLTLVLTAVGFPAFGYVRTYKDSEGEEYHGLVVNLAQARSHLESYLGQFSLGLLIDMIRYGFFNHQGFRVAYTDYCEEIGRVPEKFLARLKDALLSRGIAWYLSYRHDLAFYDKMLGLETNDFAAYVDRWNELTAAARKKGSFEESLDNWLRRREARKPGKMMCVDMVGYTAVRAIAARHGDQGLCESIIQGPDHFIALYNALDEHTLQS